MTPESQHTGGIDAAYHRVSLCPVWPSFTLIQIKTQPSVTLCGLPDNQVAREIYKSDVVFFKSDESDIVRNR